MALAARLSIAPRRLWGWEPTTFTEYVYEDGVLVGTVSTPEPEFDDEQVALLHAYEHHRRDLGPHGYSMSETTSPEADPNNREGAFKFVSTGIPTVDYAEKARLDAADAFREQFKDANTNGLIFTVEKVDRQFPNFAAGRLPQLVARAASKPHRFGHQ